MQQTYFTPINIFFGGGKNEGSQNEDVRVVLNPCDCVGNPPFTKPKKWIKRFHMFGLFFAVSNGRLKKRDTRIYHGGWSTYHQDREWVFEQQGHRCLMCGAEFESHRQMEAHHVLSWGRFPELRQKRENIVMLCHCCHKEVHCNPYLNIQLMEQKAKELGIDLKQIYNYGQTTTD